MELATLAALLLPLVVALRFAEQRNQESLGGWLIANNPPAIEGSLHQRDFCEDFCPRPLRGVVVVGGVALLLRLEEGVGDAL